MTVSVFIYENHKVIGNNFTPLYVTWRHDYEPEAAVEIDWEFNFVLGKR